MFDFDGTGIVVEQKKFENKIMPKGWYSFVILDFTTKDGSKTYPLEGETKENHYKKVDFLAEVTTEGEFKGERVFHSVTFMPKEKPGSGMAIHFLKTIGQPWENKFKVDSQEWVGAEFKGYVVEDEYKGFKKNKIAQVDPAGLSNAPGSDLPF